MASNAISHRLSEQYTLSERYQLTENIRIFRALKKICIAVSLFNAVNMSVRIYWLSFSHARNVIQVVAADLLLVNKPTNHLITRFFYNLMVTFGSLVVMLTVVTSTPLWKRVAKARLRQLLHLILCGSCNVSEKASSIATRLHTHRLSSCHTLDGYERDNRVAPINVPLASWHPSAPSTIPLGLIYAYGRPMHFETEAANEIYFKQLNDMWR